MEDESKKEPEEAQIPQVLADFLDADSVEKKHEILEEHAGEIDEHTLINMELSLDIVPDSKASMDDRIGYILYYLRTRGRFEGSRLRW